MCPTLCIPGCPVSYMVGAQCPWVGGGGGAGGRGHESRRLWPRGLARQGRGGLGRQADGAGRAGPTAFPFGCLPLCPSTQEASHTQRTRSEAPLNPGLPPGRTAPPPLPASTPTPTSRSTARERPGRAGEWRKDTIHTKGHLLFSPLLWLIYFRARGGRGRGQAGRVEGRGWASPGEVGAGRGRGGGGRGRSPGWRGPEKGRELGGREGQ